MRVTKCVRLKDESSHPWGEAKTQDLMLQGGFGTAVQTLPRQIELDLRGLNARRENLSEYHQWEI